MRLAEFGASRREVLSGLALMFASGSLAVGAALLDGRNPAQAGTKLNSDALSSPGLPNCNFWSAYLDTARKPVMNGDCANGRNGGIRCYNPKTGETVIYDWNHRGTGVSSRNIGRSSNVPLAFCVDQKDKLVSFGVQAEIAMAVAKD